MKRIITLTAAIVVAAPLILFADETPKKSSESAKTVSTTTVSTTPAPNQPAMQAGTPVADSPLVAAAKRTKRSGKKVTLITNETLSKEATSTAHITTTTTPRDVVMPEPSQESLDAERKAETAKAVKAAEERRATEKTKRDTAYDKKIEQAAARHDDEGPYGDDPAATEKMLEEMAKMKQQQQTTQQQSEKPPM